MRHASSELRARQTWVCTLEGALIQGDRRATLVSSTPQGGGTVSLSKDSLEDRQTWRRTISEPGPTSFGEVRPTSDGSWGDGRVTRIDSQALRFEGAIRGAELVWLWTEKGGLASKTERCATVRLLVHGPDGLLAWAQNIDHDRDHGETIHFDRAGYADTNPALVSTATPPRGFRMNAKRNRYQPGLLYTEGDRVTFDENMIDDQYFSFEDGDASGESVIAPPDRDTVAISLSKDGSRLGIKLHTAPRADRLSIASRSVSIENVAWGKLFASDSSDSAGDHKVLALANQTGPSATWTLAPTGDGGRYHLINGQYGYAFGSDAEKIDGCCIAWCAPSPKTDDLKRDAYKWFLVRSGKEYLLQNCKYGYLYAANGDLSGDAHYAEFHEDPKREDKFLWRLA